MRTNTFQRASICDFFCVYKYLCAWCRCCGGVRHHRSMRISRNTGPGVQSCIYVWTDFCDWLLICMCHWFHASSSDRCFILNFDITALGKFCLVRRVSNMGPLFKIDLHMQYLCDCIDMCACLISLIAQVSYMAPSIYSWPVPRLNFVLICVRLGWSWVCCFSWLADFCHTVWAPCCGFKICSSVPESEAMRLWQVKQGAVPMPCSCLVNRAHMLRCNMAAFVAAIWALGGHV